MCLCDTTSLGSTLVAVKVSLFKQEMCLLRHNFTVQHPGSCEGFPFQRGRRHMPHIPSLGYSHCEVINLKPYVFYPDKPTEVQITVNHIDSSDKSLYMMPLWPGSKM
ncbi:hypothetical protein OS493_031968 [Desmophyllum pertusum]|uniref:Uncharacterized protein n=1 Tax=Desmophyllum pertusum TaxID=174260 RepID=A0A9W9ZK51_9CNID|nr:hypothetical protein OS493_031968 [Desmophyllum pertusum]